MKYLLISFIAFLLSLSFAESAVIIPFSSPENSYQILSQYISGLQKSAYIGVYTFTSFDMADRLVEARKRGVEIKVIVDGNPAGDKVDSDIACFLEKNNIPVYLHKRGARYMHAKYIVGDNNSVAVMSENFGSDGFVGNRGWGAIVEDSLVPRNILNIFLEDIKNSDLFKCGETVSERTPSRMPEIIETKKYIEPEPTLIIAPDAVDDLVGIVDSANKSLYIEQFYIYKNWKSKPNKFLEAAIERARKGVDVKILMDSNDYNTEEGSPNSNYNTAKYIKNISGTESIPLDVKLANLKAMKVSKIHNKGLIVDNTTVLISSINWNENSPRNNRELGIAITGDSAYYYLREFLADWNSGYEEKEFQVISGKVIKRDYTQQLVTTFAFIFSAALCMILVKKRFYSSRA